ncbi:MAG: hypothetical protein OEV74_17810 [Cyclobacteriaceae bacterium]|nr:hypothetical protein [Cyclobacteriaceae bacterium]MDH4298138.1 hypothetical protein [Cyclobacteriaceae bacterium]MDH5250835.1 hypothetical protein [Cyclobacteriaceae bacterium]
MTKPVHRIYVGTMVLAVIAVTAYLIYTGYSYYDSPLEERFYHPRHDWFKPSGAFGHGLGILGTLMILFGVSIYIARKRYNFLTKQLRLKYLLEFHIFLCTLGPILILFHTAFKFGGIVSIAFWSMVAVVLSGVIGRFVYIQIPRTIEGRELTLNEVKHMQEGLSDTLKRSIGIDDQIARTIVSLTSGHHPSGNGSGHLGNRKAIGIIRKILRQRKIGRKQRRYIIKLAKEEISLSNKIRRLQTMQKLFKYWHVAHLPFALIMLIILIIHVAVTLSFGYKWIF